LLERYMSAGGYFREKPNPAYALSEEEFIATLTRH
jgi:hypothetical protein